ncbi:hypothetical protein MY7_2486 [Bacillus sp. 5B6]|nr:hypothetical protein MY7_2486 [Bacillus sp. 5B6]
MEGFSVLDKEKSNVLLSYFDIEGEMTLQPVTERDYKEVIEALNRDTLDIEGKTKSRAEQFLERLYSGIKPLTYCRYAVRNSLFNF